LKLSAKPAAGQMTEFRNHGADFHNLHRSLKSEHCHSPKNDFPGLLPVFRTRG
jgi:hypothetical protein